MKAIRLKTADLTDAFGIDILKPRLSWNCSGGKVQTAFRVVARNEKKETVFDTGKRASHRMYCDYEGRPQAHSFNHYSPGAMCSFLFDTVCGIRVDGENKISIKPKPGGTLTHAKAKVLTAYGEIISGWEKEDNVIKYTFTVPANVTANLILPDGTENTLSAGSHYYRELRMS